MSRQLKAQSTGVAAGVHCGVLSLAQALVLIKDRSSRQSPPDQMKFFGSHLCQDNISIHLHVDDMKWFKEMNYSNMVILPSCGLAV